MSRHSGFLLPTISFQATRSPRKWRVLSNGSCEIGIGLRAPACGDEHLHAVLGERRPFRLLDPVGYQAADLRTTLDLPDGQPGIVMAIHTFGVPFPDYDTEPVMMYANG